MKLYDFNFIKFYDFDSLFQKKSYCFIKKLYKYNIHLAKKFIINKIVFFSNNFLNTTQKKFLKNPAKLYYE